MRDAELINALTRRGFIIAGAEAALFVVLAARLYQLQVREESKYRRMSERNSIRIRLTLPPRGKILDRNGAELAGNKNIYSIHMIPEEVVARGGSVEETLGKISRKIALSEAEKEAVRAAVGKKRAFFPVSVKSNLGWAQMAAIQAESLDLAGVYATESPARHYKDGASAAHALGYVSAPSEEDTKQDTDPLLSMPDFKTGKAGVERTFERDLRGHAGEEKDIVNAVGRVVDNIPEERVAPRAGRDTRLTLDARLQKYAAERMAAEPSACAVVMDVWNGDVLAMHSTPTYDPNIFIDEERTADEFKRLVANKYKPFVNKTLEGLYSPGSTFKMMTALAALETGAITPASKFRCDGHLDLGNRKWWCWRPQGHGLVDFEHSLAWSCDVYYYNVATKVDIDAIQDMAHRFGFGEATGIELPNERAGQVPARNWKANYRAERWFTGDTLAASIGQGFTLTTPLQLCQMAARLANGGFKVAPRIVKSEFERVFPERIAVNDLHLELVRRGMFSVVNGEGGTGSTARFNHNGATMSGKTGTTQVRSVSAAERARGVISQSALPWELRNHALFVGYAPSDKPKYAVSVLVEHGASGSGAAAPIARDLMRKTIEILGAGNA